MPTVVIQLAGWLARHPRAALVLAATGLATVALPVLLIFVGIFVLAGAAGSSPEPDRCGPPAIEQASLDTSGLTETQLHHAGVVIAEGRDRGLPDRALVIALATVAQESRFLNYANDGTSPDLAPEQRDVHRSLRLPHDAVGNDHGSLGIFQQQYPWWGSIDELMDPPTAAGLFFDALVEVTGWESMPVTAAAQAVQASAFPDAYAKWEPLARELLAMHDVDHRGVRTDGDPREHAGSGCAPPASSPPNEWILPLLHGSYTMSSPFGMRLHPIRNEYRMHTGTDFAAPTGTEVFAASSGEVTWAGHSNGYGNLIVVASGDVEHYYAHLTGGGIYVRAGDEVAAGQLIGGVGSTGLSTGPHLHFEIRINGDPVDPVPFLERHGVDPAPQARGTS